MSKTDKSTFSAIEGVCDGKCFAAPITGFGKIFRHETISESKVITKFFRREDGSVNGFGDDGKPRTSYFCASKTVLSFGGGSVEVFRKKVIMEFVNFLMTLLAGFRDGVMMSVEINFCVVKQTINQRFRG